MKRIQDVMSRDVTTIEHEAKLHEAATRLKERDIGCLPVIDRGKLVGMITDRDIVVRAIAEGRDPRTATVAQHMTASPKTAKADEPVDRAAESMKKAAVRRLVVVDDDLKPIGLLSLGDIAACKGDAETAKRAGEVLSTVCAEC